MNTLAIVATVTISIASTSVLAMNGHADRINEERFSPQKNIQITESEIEVAMNGRSDRINEEKTLPEDTV